MSSSVGTSTRNPRTRTPASTRSRHKSSGRCVPTRPRTQPFRRDVSQPGCISAIATSERTSCTKLPVRNGRKANSWAIMPTLALDRLTIYPCDKESLAVLSGPRCAMTTSGGATTAALPNHDAATATTPLRACGRTTTPSRRTQPVCATTGGGAFSISDRRYQRARFNWCGPEPRPFA